MVCFSFKPLLLTSCVLYLGLIAFDSHVDAVAQIQIEVNVGRKSGVKGLIKGILEFFPNQEN